MSAELQNKTGTWLLKAHEQKLKDFLVSKVPRSVETYHLTYLTLLWSVCIVLCCYVGIYTPFYLWLVPLFVVLQYVTDLLDGAVGRARETGLVLWGYYADHFLDYIFLLSILFGYAFFVDMSFWYLLLVAGAAGFMVHAFLLAATNKTVQISFLGTGPTEGRLVFILFHVCLVAVGVDWFGVLLPYLVVALWVGLAVVSLVSQRMLWATDMNNKGEYNI